MAPQRDEDVRLARLAGAAGIVSEKNQIRWRPSPSWLPYPKSVTASTKTVVTEQMYKDALHEHFPGVPAQEAADSWAIFARARASRSGTPLPDGVTEQPVSRPAAAPPTEPVDEDDDLGLGSIGYRTN